MQGKQSGCLNVKHGHVSWLISNWEVLCETFQCFICLHGFVAFLRNFHISVCGCSYALPATPAFFEGYARATPHPYVVYTCGFTQNWMIHGIPQYNSFSPITSHVRAMTQLHTVQHHHISLHCSCGHGALISVKSLLETLPPETTVHTVATKAKCSKCGSKVGKDFRLHWKCGWLDATLCKAKET